ncbi:MAG: MBL fold metallo-hydrolase [Chloroflexi bacterium]|nr:MBL fold metallo-hydrolase [Chloroflexota bacterium]
MPDLSFRAGKGFSPELRRILLLLAVVALVLISCGLPSTSTPVTEQVTDASASPAASPSATANPAAQAQSALVVTYIDVGQGDAILIQSPEGENVLIDGGPDSLAYRYLSQLGVKHLSAVVATHPHADHIGGLPEVLRNCKVDAVWTNGQEYTTPSFEDFVDAITASGAKYYEVQSGNTIKVGSLAFNVLSPGAKLYSDLNESSLVLRLQYKNVSFLFAGDAGETAEAAMLKSGQSLQSTVLKVGHHGSNSASSAPFLRAVQPSVAIWMAGVNNDYGHPHRETLARLAQTGAKVFGTAVDGTIQVFTDGDRLWVKTAAGPTTEITIRR